MHDALIDYTRDHTLAETVLWLSPRVRTSTRAVSEFLQWKGVTRKGVNKKSRGNAKLITLPTSQQSEINDFGTRHTIAATVEMCQQRFGVFVSTATVSNFLAWHSRKAIASDVRNQKPSSPVDIDVQPPSCLSDDSLSLETLSKRLKAFACEQAFRWWNQFKGGPYERSQYRLVRSWIAQALGEKDTRAFQRSIDRAFEQWKQTGQIQDARQNNGRKKTNSAISTLAAAAKLKEHLCKHQKQ